MSSCIEVRRHSSTHPWTYPMLDARQREIAAAGGGALLVSELAPVITTGRRTDLARDLALSREQYARLGTEIVPVDRGGFATWHGPGHWVVFPVFTLERLTGDPTGVRKAVELLLDWGLQVARAYTPDAEVRRGAELGVWTPRGKVISLGVRVSRGMLLHGLGINGLRTPQSFAGMRPCGLDAAVDYLLEPSLGDLTPSSEARERRFRELGQKIIHVGSGLLNLTLPPDLAI